MTASSGNLPGQHSSPHRKSGGQHPRGLARACPRVLRLRTGVGAFPRSDGTVQVGCAELRALRIRPPSPLDQAGCLALLALLRTGHTSAQLRAEAKQLGAQPSAVDGLLRLLLAADLLVRQPRTPPRVHVHGSGPVSTGLRGALEAGGVEVTSTREAPLRRDLPEYRPDLVVLADRVAPDPAIIHQLLVAGTAHMQIRLVDGDGCIGPLVLPGSTGCLWCEQHHATDADPLRPELLRHIGADTGHAEPAILRAVLAQAALQIDHSLHCLRNTGATPPRVLGSIIEVRHNGILSPPKPQPPHPECLFHAIRPHH